MINILCDKTWCTHNGAQGRVNRCYYGTSINITNNSCNKYECEKTSLIRMGVLDSNKSYSGCQYCSNKNCKYKK